MYRLCCNSVSWELKSFWCHSIFDFELSSLSYWLTGLETLIWQTETACSPNVPWKDGKNFQRQFCCLQIMSSVHISLNPFFTQWSCQHASCATHGTGECSAGVILYYLDLWGRFPFRLAICPWIYICNVHRGALPAGIDVFDHKHWRDYYHHTWFNGFGLNQLLSKRPLQHLSQPFFFPTCPLSLMISRSVGMTCLDLCMNEKKAQLVVTMYNNYFTYKFLYFFIFIHSSIFAPLRWFLPRNIDNIWIEKALIKWRLSK